MNLGFLLAQSGDQAAGNSTTFILVYLVIMVLMFVFMFNGPQKKEKKRLESMLADLAIGDNVLTTSGFYGMVIDIADDTVIVEFGSNKNCRIPMNKSAIAQVEKPGESKAPEEKKDKKKEKSDKEK